ncbi:MAG: tetratricopeptide repeat protein [Alistipes sp.]|nr:tetratricopeptide repeat protein [Alistipes sp.]
MKRMFVAAMAALLLAAPAVQAQKVNKDAILAKLEKSDADLVNPKKNTKAATWLNRGKVYYEAATAPTKDVFQGMEVMMLQMSPAMGNPMEKKSEVLNGVEYEAWVYPYLTLYIAGGKVATWIQREEVFAGAAKVAAEAYAKAYELDKAAGEKVKAGLQQLSDYHSQVGNICIDAALYPQASDAYKAAYEAQAQPAYGNADATLLYYAGYLRTMDGPKNVESFEIGANLLNEALALGFADPEGSIYYYLFHCYYGQKAKGQEYVMQSKQALLTGIEKFPKNERILEGLMQLYTAEEGVGDPADLVSMFDKQLAETPENVELWFGRGRIFYALKNYDEAIVSFKKVVELKPEMYEGNFFLAAFYVYKGDAMAQELNTRNYTSQKEYDADYASVSEVYKQALPYFEKAYEVNPASTDALESLKSLCFRLRDEPGVMEKFTHYNSLWRKSQGLE